jgi:endonuclease/exonuclease/phosphatase (EEP) superfamily protein YafD
MAMIACHLVLIWPDLRPATSPATATRQSRAVRIYFANVHASNRNLEGILSEARSFDPDVIVLAEMQRWWWRQMISRNPLPDYPYGTNLARRRFGCILSTAGAQHEANCCGRPLRAAGRHRS